MDFGKAFTFVFDDPDWLKKIVIAALIGLIPIIGQIYLVGYGLEVARRVIKHNPVLLPDIAFGESLATGFKSFIIGMVYAIPVFLMILPVLLFLVPVTSTTSTGGTDYSSAEPIAVALSLCCIGLLTIYGILLWVWIPAANGNFLATNSLGAAFRFNEVFALLKAAPGAYLFVLLGGIVGGFIASLGTIGCGIGVLLTSTYAVALSGHLTGQAYNEAIANKALM